MCKNGELTDYQQELEEVKMENERRRIQLQERIGELEDALQQK